jgi:hypothetical protein
VNREVLCRPFPPEAVKTRPGQRGKTLSYVEVATVIARLNEGCESWSFEVVSHRVDADEVIVVGKLTADGQTKMHFGGASITLGNDGRAVSVADDLKAAASDALKKCASLFGVALEMYGGACAASNGRSRPRAPEPDDRVSARQLAAIQAACRLLLTTKTREPDVQIERLARRRGDERELTETVLDVLHAVHAGVDVRIRGWGCRSCVFASVCGA